MISPSFPRRRESRSVCFNVLEVILKPSFLDSRLRGNDTSTSQIKHQHLGVIAIATLQLAFRNQHRSVTCNKFRTIDLQTTAYQMNISFACQI